MARGKGAIQKDFTTWSEKQIQDNTEAYMRHMEIHLAMVGLEGDISKSYEYVEEIPSNWAAEPEKAALGKLLLKYENELFDFFLAPLRQATQKQFLPLRPKTTEPDRERVFSFYRLVLELLLASRVDLVEDSFSSAKRDLHFMMGGIACHMRTYLLHTPLRGQGLLSKGVGSPSLQAPIRGANDIAHGLNHQRTIRTWSIRSFYEVLAALGDSLIEPYLQRYTASPLMGEKLLKQIESLSGMSRDSLRMKILLGSSSTFYDNMSSFRKQLAMSVLGAIEKLRSGSYESPVSKEPNVPSKSSARTRKKGMPTVEPISLAEFQTPLTPFAPPHLPLRLGEFDIAAGSRHELTLNQFNPNCRRVLLTCPPHGGKSRTLCELLVTHSLQNFYRIISLRAFFNPGHRDFYKFVAFSITDDLELSSEIEMHLIRSNKTKEILWCFEDYDLLSPSDKSFAQQILSGLGAFVVSTADAHQILSEMRSRQLDLPDSIVTILPLDADEQLEFIEQFVSMYPEAERHFIDHIISILPGLASLPGGLRFICENTQVESITQLLFDFVNRNQTRLGYPPLGRTVEVDVQFGWLHQFDSPCVQSAFEIVKYTMTKTQEVSLELDLSRLTIQRVERGLILEQPGPAVSVQTLFERAEQGQLIVGNLENTGKSWRFVVPEFGMLLAFCRSTFEYIQLYGKYLEWLYRRPDRPPHGALLFTFAAELAERRISGSSS